MFRRTGLALLLGGLLTSLAVPAFAAPLEPLKLENASLSVSGPQPNATRCDKGSELNCGSVTVSAEFSGLEGRNPPSTTPYSGYLSGTARVTRTLGCSLDGKRLRKYDVKVRAEEPLDPRRYFPYRLPATGDTVTLTIYAFLLAVPAPDCPTGAQAVTYEIRANKVRLTLDSYEASIPDATYAVPGTAVWRGAVPMGLAS